MSNQSLQFDIDSRKEELATVNDCLATYIYQHGLPESLLLTSQLVIEELIVNTVDYGYGGESGHTISITLNHDHQHLTVEIADEARAFNPLTMKGARLGLPADDEPEGGLGVHLVKEMCHTCHYEYADGKNRFTATLLIEQ